MRDNYHLAVKFCVWQIKREIRVTFERDVLTRPFSDFNVNEKKKNWKGTFDGEIARERVSHRAILSRNRSTVFTERASISLWGIFMSNCSHTRAAGYQ
jgi:hypothetical protein